MGLDDIQKKLVAPENMLVSRPAHIQNAIDGQADVFFKQLVRIDYKKHIAAYDKYLEKLLCSERVPLWDARAKGNISKSAGVYRIFFLMNPTKHFMSVRPKIYRDDSATICWQEMNGHTRCERS